jgi:DNA-binding beta-propeller fold protein YncE
MHLLTALTISSGLVLLTGCDADEGPIDPGAEAIPLPGGEDGISFDDLHFAPDIGRVVAPGGSTDRAVLVDPETMDVAALGSGDAVQSADAGGGLVFALHRDDDSLEVLDAESGASLSSTPIGGGADYVRYVSSRSEVWVTEPGSGRIEILALPADGDPVPVSEGFVTIGSGPEGLAIDDARGVAYAHRFSGELVVIDLAERAVTDGWDTGCGGAHGIPTFDSERGLVFAGCRETEVVVLDASSGAVLDRRSMDDGVTILAYSSALGHFYLRGDPGQTVEILAVGDDGRLSLLGEVQAGLDGHCAQADDAGHFFVCDARRGQLLRFTDPYPAVTAAP